MKYLIDSLQSYETGHSDALCPIQREADEWFMGEHQGSRPVTQHDLDIKLDGLARRICNDLEQSAARSRQHNDVRDIRQVEERSAVQELQQIQMYLPGVVQNNQHSYAREGLTYVCPFTSP